MIELNKILILESVLLSDSKESLLNKYLLIISRNILNLLRKNHIIHKGSNTIKIETLVHYLKQIGYQNHSKKRIQDLISSFKKSTYVKSYNKEFLTIQPKSFYEDDKFYLTYYVDSTKFTFRKFKKEVVEFEYSKPSYKNKNVRNKKRSDCLVLFTSQSKISTDLNISRTSVAYHSKNKNKIYAYKKIHHEFKDWNSARDYLYGINAYNPSQYTIKPEFIDGVVKYYVYKLSGSKLVKTHDLENMYYYKNNTKRSSYRRNISLNRYQDFSNGKSFDGKKVIRLCQNKLHEGTLITEDKENLSELIFNEYNYILGKEKSSKIFSKKSFKKDIEKYNKRILKISRSYQHEEKA